MTRIAKTGARSTMQSTTRLYTALVLALITACISALNSGSLMVSIATLALCVPILIFVRPHKIAEVNIKKWQDIFDDAPALMAMIDIRGNIVSSNAAFNSMCGLSRKQVQNSSIQKIMGEEAWQEITPHTSKLADGITTSLEFDRVFVDANGKERLVRAYTRFVDNPGSNKDRYAILQIVDFTDQHDAQLALTASESRFRGIIENIPQMLCIVQHDNRIAYGNPSAHEVLNLNEEGKSEAPFENFISPPHQTKFIQAITESRENPGSRVTLDKVRLINNEYVDMHLTDKSSLEGISGTLIALQSITSHINAETMLRSSEEKFATTFHSSPDAMLIIRASDSIIIDLNTSFTRLLGYTREEAVGGAETGMKFWVDSAEREAMLKVLDAEYECLEYEADLLAKNGEIINAEISLRYVQIEGELCIIVNGRDVSRRRQAENALLASEEKFARIFTNSPDGIVIIRLSDNIILDANDMFLMGSGYEREELMGKSFYELNAITNTEHVKSISDKLMQRGKVQNTQVDMRTKSGEILPTLLSATVMELNGEPSLLVIMKDHSAQLRTEEKLKRSEERFRMTFENAPIGIMLIDAEGRIFQVNNYASEMLEYTNEALLSRYISELLPQDDRAELKQSLETLLTTNSSVDATERKLQCLNGKTISTNFHIVLQRSNTGNPLYFIVQITDITQMKHSQQQMERLAFYDTLTDLPNRRLFNSRMEQCLKISKRNESISAILFLDLDKFKRINDTLGHNHGDDLLREVAERLNNCVRGEDTVARLGGDEFSILLNNISSPRDAGIVAEKILDILRQPIKLGDQEVVVTTSIGIALIPGDSQSPEVLIKFADLAMYRAKEEGRNNYQYYSGDMNLQSHNRLDLESQLRTALENDEFVLHFQPKVELQTNKIMGMECLIRWNHPDRGFLTPDEFIPVAEQTGIIIEIGDWVIREACRAASIASRIAGYPVNTAINVSPRQFRQHSLISTISDCIEEYDLNPSQLEFETTETTLMLDLDAAGDTLLRLHQLGVQLAIDDFGTGYSSLQHLRRFPFDIVKIDRSFVMDIPDNKDDMAITSAVIAMSHSLNLKVVAEGIETREQLDYLLANGCEFGQGYYFSKAIPLDDITKLLTPGISLLRRADKP